jgi:hypothetical protein
VIWVIDKIEPFSESYPTDRHGSADRGKNAYQGTMPISKVSDGNLDMADRLTEFHLRVLGISVGLQLDEFGLARFAIESQAFTCPVAKFCEILVVFALILSPSPEADYLSKEERLQSVRATNLERPFTAPEKEKILTCTSLICEQEAANEADRCSEFYCLAHWCFDGIGAFWSMSTEMDRKMLVR